VKAVKHAFDLVSAAVGLALVSPLFLLVALLTKCSDAGPVFFRQKRVGKGGQTFEIWKFRTMITDAEQQGGQLTVGDDARITRLGHWLRKFKLDELPQLINVLLGQMSLVGPRPEVPHYVDLYTPEQRKVLELLPGITDPASIRFRNESELLAGCNDPERYYVERIMPEKIQNNLQYAAEATLWSDLRVIAQTIVKLGR